MLHVASKKIFAYTDFFLYCFGLCLICIITSSKRRSSSPEVVLNFCKI